MPLYICYCPDYPGTLEKRLEARAEHFAGSLRDREAGKTVFGRGFLDDANSHFESHGPPEIAEGQPNPGMSGSCMIYRYPNLDAAWARLKSDPYWVNGVWDKEKAVIKELLGTPADDTLKIA